MRAWMLVTENRPDSGDYPVTAIVSRDRERAIWTSGLIPEITEEIRREVNPFFDEGENVRAEEWYAIPS